MILLQETGSAQLVQFIGRSEATGAAKAYFTNEETNTTYTYDVTLSTSTNYTQFTEVLGDLLEDKNYFLIVEQSNTELYRGNVFVTNQSGYSINNGEFLERTTTNDFLVYE